MTTTTNEIKTSVRVKMATEAIYSISSTGPTNYYNSAGQALGLIFDICDRYGLELTESYLVNATNEGRRKISVTFQGQEVAVLVYTWYRLASGRFEVTCYMNKI